MRKVLFGLLWFAVIYFVGAVAIGIVVGVDHRHDSRAVVEAAAAAAITKYELALLLASGVLAAIGAVMGVLPGTRKKPAQQDATP